jgi:hypothetical protein
MFRVWLKSEEYLDKALSVYTSCLLVEISLEFIEGNRGFSN